MKINSLLNDTRTRRWMDTENGFYTTSWIQATVVICTYEKSQFYNNRQEHVCDECTIQWDTYVVIIVVYHRKYVHIPVGQSNMKCEKTFPLIYEKLCDLCLL